MPYFHKFKIITQFIVYTAYKYIPKKKLRSSDLKPDGSFSAVCIVKEKIFRSQNMMSSLLIVVCQGSGGWTQMLLITDYYELGSLYDFLQNNVLDHEAAVSIRGINLKGADWQCMVVELRIQYCDDIFQDSVEPYKTFCQCVITEIQLKVDFQNHSLRTL